ncbi:hypothetical protein DY023_02475 [Microbacterium bovistercoris]|uniref:Uncharacterized protein n=2 Tax=Microbacterium bovistercoris TaxID=2293570 RepID=A0A371NYN4_9MICO|nr:hypothetical protein DY023_02475 [Microbacterium bovistercoris]
MFAEADAETAAAPEAPGAASTAPRTRWAAIVWGLFFAGLAFGGIWLLSDPQRRDSVTDWLAGLAPATIIAVSLLAVGVLVLVAGLAGLLRRLQRRMPH